MLLDRRQDRFIPAHTGNIPSPPLRHRPPTVHPRTHGEHFIIGAAPSAVSGSSPHTRGTFPDRLKADKISRFIPAHTGNIGEPIPRGPQSPVHPRTHGEHSSAPLPLVSPIGSSPHTRGTSGHGREHRGLVRFIPAHTGNMASFTHLPIELSVHPRTHGEHPELAGKLPVAVGSSPHTRGTSIPYWSRQRVLRFIPAHTGNIRRAPVSSAARAVHPRTHGEHCSTPYIRREKNGSSPHTRGT